MSEDRNQVLSYLEKIFRNLVNRAEHTLADLLWWSLLKAPLRYAVIE